MQRRINTGDLNDHRKFDSHTLPPYLSDLTVVAKKRGAKGGIKGYASGFCEQFSAARVTTGSQNA